MSGGRRIDDHSSWMGGKSKGSVFPEGVKTMNEASAEGAGEVSMYCDTTEAIKEQQMTGVRKASGSAMKPGNRN